MLHTTETGPADGRPLLFLHGFLGSGRNLASLARRLTALDPSCRALLVDLPGHGRSPPLPPEAPFDHLPAAVLATLDRLAPGRPAALVGHSLGGRVGLALAGLAPARFDAIAVLDIAPGPIPPGSDVEAVLGVLADLPAAPPSLDAARDALVAGGLTRALADWLLMNLERTPTGALAWRIDRAALAAAHHRWRGLDLWDRARPPVRLCVRGGRSPFVTDADVARYREAGIAVATLPAAGHFVHVDALDDLVAALAPALGLPP